MSSSSGSITVNFVGLASGTTYSSLMPTVRLPRFAELSSTLELSPSSATAADEGATDGQVAYSMMAWY